MTTPVLFDFNGTMFFDTEKHKAAWRKFFYAKLKRPLTNEEFQRYVYGPPNDFILRHFLGADLPAAECSALSEEKEKIYRDLCLDDPDGLHLAEGLTALLYELQRRNTPMNIATGSCKSNVDFYFSAFGLDRWFDPEKVAYDDGTTPGKPDPAIYHHAARNIGVSAADCTIFEDSAPGILAARASGAKKVIVIDKNAEKSAPPPAGVFAVAPDFRGVSALLSSDSAPKTTANGMPFV